VRPPSQSDSRVATRGHFLVPVRFLLRGIHFEGWMHDGTITVDAKRAPSAKHTASRTSWLHTR
jgi:hypothetical protein